MWKGSSLKWVNDSNFSKCGPSFSFKRQHIIFAFFFRSLMRFRIQRCPEPPPPSWTLDSPIKILPTQYLLPQFSLLRVSPDLSLLACVPALSLFSARPCPSLDFDRPLLVPSKSTKSPSTDHHWLSRWLGLGLRAQQTGAIKGAMKCHRRADEYTQVNN